MRRSHVALTLHSRVLRSVKEGLQLPVAHRAWLGARSSGTRRSCGSSAHAAAMSALPNATLSHSVDVTRDNFTAMLPIIRAAIERCEFFASELPSLAAAAAMCMYHMEEGCHHEHHHWRKCVSLPFVPGPKEMVTASYPRSPPPQPPCTPQLTVK